MGLIDKIIRVTPFYGAYQQYKKRKNAAEQERLDRTFFPRRVKFYKDFINENDLVFDVGANVGNRVEAFLECKAKVVAVEPQPACIKTLEEKFGGNISIEKVGLSEAPGELEMQVATDSTVSTFNKEYIDKTKERFKYSKWDKTIKVPVTTMDTLIEKHGTPKFCKIDVEGFELYVLKGLHHRIPYVSIEYCVPEMQEQNLQCLEYINGIAPDATYNYSIGESMEWALDRWMNYSDFIQHIKSADFTKTSFGDIYIKTV